jgi:hypothetical protein
MKTLKSMWLDFRRDDRPDWERMSDDSMNKVLKFCVTCVFAYGGYHVVIAIIERFS